MDFEPSPRSCDAGLVFIGPLPESIAAMGHVAVGDRVGAGRVV